MGESRHLRASLLLIAVFLSVGMILEAMHGVRSAGIMTDPIAREFLRLGHAHGGLLALLNLGIAWAMGRLQTPDRWAAKVRLASLLGALVVGMGFIGGGLWHGPTDPGPLVLAVPAGALMLLASLLAVVLVRPAGADSNDAR